MRFAHRTLGTAEAIAAMRCNDFPVGGMATGKLDADRLADIGRERERLKIREERLQTRFI